MSKITESARGENCQVRIPGVCNFNAKTTVLAHINGAGMAMKASDIHAAYACSDCHDAIDYRSKTEYSRDELKMMHYEGMVRTQSILLKSGLITIR